MRGWSNFLDWTCRREISGPRVYVCVLVSTGSLFSNCSQVPSPPPAGMKAFPTFLSTFGVICVFSLFAYPKGAKWYPVVLMCMFLITVEVQHTYTPPPTPSLMSSIYGAEFLSPTASIRGCCLYLFFSIKIWAVQPDNWNLVSCLKLQDVPQASVFPREQQSSFMIRRYPWQPSQQHLNEINFILFYFFCEHMKVKMHFSDCGFQEWEGSLVCLL